MPMPSTVDIVNKKILAKAWGTLFEYVIAFRRRDGTIQNLVREVYDHGNAAAILLIDPKRRVLTLVRQFRLPAHLAGDDGQMLEICAGLLDGDAPETCARKEALEETGIAPATLTHAFDIYASPGSLSEKTHCFIGTYSPASRVGTGGGLDHEGEDIEIVEIGFSQALRLIDTGAIMDAKTVATIQHAALTGMLS